MTIVEFLHPLKGKPLRELCLAILYFEQRYSSKDALTVEEIRALLKRARVPRAAKLNLADVLSKSAPFVDASGQRGNRFLWALTTTGQGHVRIKLGLPESDVEIEHDVSSLESVLASIQDESVSDYIREAVKCLSVGAMRAAVVFLWAGTTRHIQETVFACGAKVATDAALKFDPKARTIKKVDDFAYIKESTLLLAAQEVGVFDKNQRATLEEALNLRNRCGHPGKYKLGSKKVSSVIEDVVGIVFS